ncbi:MAG: hypothetical protein NC184_06445 [Roseburia sp.]|nr:hypothetical protein [Roseburia sp.]
MRRLSEFKRSDSAEREASELAGDVTGKYAGMSGDRLMSELMKNVAAAKGNGTFSEEQIDEFVRFVSPQLDDASRERLNELVSMIKGTK